MSRDSEFVITFPDSSPADANRAAEELCELLLAKVDGITVEVRRNRADTQDLGTTLVLLCGTGAALAVAKGIQAFLTKRGTKIRIVGARGEVVVSGDIANPGDVVEAAAKILGP